MSVSTDQGTTNFIRPSLRGFDKLVDVSAPKTVTIGSVSSTSSAVPLQSIAVIHKEEPAMDLNSQQPAESAATIHNPSVAAPVAPQIPAETIVPLAVVHKEQAP